MDEILIKNKEDIAKMTEGGKKLSRIKNALKNAVRAGVSAQEIEDLAVDLIEKSGGKESFKMVPGYSWATCVNINKGLVHGIPKPETIFQKGDIVSVDVGLFYNGFHTDTSFSVAIGEDSETKIFLLAGQEALENAIKSACIGNRIYDISKAIEDTITKHGFTPIRALVGHGVGKKLHEEPQIPCFTLGSYTDSPKVCEGMALAIEVMYAKGSADVVRENDGWTISTADGKISALYEETVAVTRHGPLVLTRE